MHIIAVQGGAEYQPGRGPFWCGVELCVRLVQVTKHHGLVPACGLHTHSRNHAGA